MRKPPSFEQTTRLVARALGTDRDGLLAGFRRVQVADLPAVVALRRQALGALVRWDDAAYLRWRYHLDERPGFRGCELWMLQLGGRLIGIVGRELSEALYDGRMLRLSRGMDVLIDPAHEASGVGVWLSQVHHDDADLAIAVGANDNSVGIIQRLYEAMPPRRPYLLPLDFRRLLPHVGLPPWAASVLGLPINALGPLLHWWRRPRRAGHLRIHPIERFTPALLDPLITEQQRRAATRVEILRTADLLNWRLFDNPRARYEVLGAFDGERCVGYVAKRRLTGLRGAPSMHLIDWLTVGEGRTANDILARLFEAAIREARSKGCAMVQTVVRHADSETLLRQRGFLTGRHAPYLVLGLHSRHPALQALADRPAAWCVTDLSFDNDGCY